jgi:hypothetical protein
VSCRSTTVGRALVGGLPAGGEVRSVLGDDAGVVVLDLVVFPGDEPFSVPLIILEVRFASRVTCRPGRATMCRYVWSGAGGR